MSTMNITYSSEMMNNRLQAELIAPQKKFEALQTNDGHALLFSIGTDGIMYLTHEKSGVSAAGYDKHDLSSKQIKKDFTTSVKCKTFDVSQSAQDGTIGMAMVVAGSTGDKLYLSLGNSNTDTSWVKSPNWVAFNYDNTNRAVSKLEIVNVFFCETSGNNQYIIVDVVEDPTSTKKDIYRYYIDPSKSTGEFWNEHDIAIDIEEGHYDSCLGRSKKGYVDGLYTAGIIGSTNSNPNGTAQLIFTPVINAFGDGPPTVVRLKLPGKEDTISIASVRNADLSTDLFAVFGNSLYYFASDNQKDSASGVKILTNDILSKTKGLSAMLHNGIVTLWGRNGSDEVYYLSCALSGVSVASNWNIPVPILTGIEAISPFLNVKDGGNTIFAAGGGKLEKINQDNLSASKIWRTSQITLPVLPTQASIAFNSYTTTIQVTNENNLPYKGAAISLSANNRCSVYVNGLYYMLDSTPIHVKSNSFGTITIVEATDTLNGTTFTLSSGGGTSITINPMDNSFKKLASLGDSSGDTSKLSKATIKEEDGTTRPLVSGNPSAANLKVVSQSLADLGTTYNGLQNSPQVAFAVRTPNAPQPMSVGGDILMAIGDLFKWLESGVEAIVTIVKDALTSAWHFIVKIAGKIYRAILDTVHAIVGAAIWIFDKIKTAVKDIIQFVKFLFDWNDIKRTKEVIHNLTKCFLNSQVDSIKHLKDEFDDMIDGLEEKIDKWAGIDDWSSLGDAASKPAHGSASNPMKGQNSGSQHLSHHFQNNAKDITIKGDAPEPSLVMSLINDLINGLKQEGKVFVTFITRLEKLAKEFSSLTVEEVLKKLVAILVDGVLSSAKVVVDVMFNILIDIAKAAISILDTKLHIPVISDILNAIGIPDISFLDLFSWIASVAYTVVYKIAEGKAPFPDDANTTFLINAKSLDELKAAFTKAAPPSRSMRTAPQVNLAAAAAAGPIAMPEGVQLAVFVAGLAIAGFCSLMSDFVTTFEAAEESGDNAWAIPSAVLGIIGAGSSGVANFLVPKDPIQNKVVSTINTGTTAIVILSKIIFSGPLQKKFAASAGVMSNLAAGDGRATGAIVNSVLIIPALVCSGWHFYELSLAPAGKEKTDAVLGEVANLTSYISRVSYTIAVNDDDPESKAIAIGVMAVANVATAGLQTAEAVVH